MNILTVLRKRLQDSAGVTSIATGGIYMNNVEQASGRPNVMLMLVSGSDEWTHQGPDGLHQDVVRIYSRSDDMEGVGTLAAAINAALNGWSGAYYGVSVALTQHINRAGDYQDAAKVYRQIDDYRVTYRLS